MNDRAVSPPKLNQTRYCWRICTSIVAFALLCGAPASAAMDKNAAYQEMLGLAQQMRSLKPQMRTSPGAASAYATAESRYRQISASMGGDDPGHVDAGLVDQLGELVVVDDRRRLLALAHLTELRSGERGVQVEDVGAELGQGGGGIHEEAVVAAQHRNAVPLRDTDVLEPVREPGGPLVDLRPGQLTELVDQPGLVG